MAVQIMIQFDGKNLTIPINPEELKVNQSATNNNIDIIGLGPVTRKGTPELETTVIESFFPGPNSYYYKGVLPSTCIEFIKKIWNTENINNNVAKIVTTGLPVNLNMYFVIEDFDYDNKAGEEDDIYFELKIKRYIPYGVKTVTTELTGLASARATSPAIENTQPTQNTYTVESGDCLWNITKAATGNGANWEELYELNKDVIGPNPNLIYPGQVLTLPNGWNIPGQVPKLQNISNKKAKVVTTQTDTSISSTITSNTDTSQINIDNILSRGNYREQSKDFINWAINLGATESKPIQRSNTGG